MGLLQLHYYQYKEAEKNFDTAYAISGISCNLDGRVDAVCRRSMLKRCLPAGALGVRTKFQQSAVAQLKVQIDRKSDGFKSFSPLLSEDDVAKVIAFVKCCVYHVRFLLPMAANYPVIIGHH